MKSSPSPLFEPALWQDNKFRLLNELSLPDRVEYIDVADVETALDAAKAQELSSARAC